MLGLGLGLNKSKKRGDLPPLPPVNIVQPFLVGTGEIGENLVCNKGTWSGRPAPTYTYNFRVNSVSVQNSASNIYVPQPADEGLSITCLVQAINPSGSATEGTSNSVIAGYAPVNTALPTLDVTGNQVIGTTTITATDGTWTGTAPITYQYRWTRNGIPISGETTNTYTLQPADETATIRVQVRAINAYETTPYVTSDDSVVAGYEPVNTGLPEMNLSGNQLVGQTIGFTTEGTWTGTPTVTLQYRWLRNGSPIGGAINNTYTLVAADDGATITAQVRGTNAWGTSAYSTSSNSINAGTAPVNLVAPTVTPSGTQSTDAVITVNVGTWSGTPTILYAYRWTRNGTPITGAVNSTYTIQASDDGTTIRCEVQGSNAFGTSAYVASSNSVSAVNAIAPVNISAPTISGSTTLGSTLTSTTGTWTGIPTPTYSYQWFRGATPIGTNQNTYVITLADSGANITCRVTATNTAGSANSTSNIITLPSYAPINTVAPVISGTAVVGQTLSTTNGTWDNNPTSFSYQWRRGGVDIGGATSPTYTLVQADAGNTSNITCVVTANNGLTTSANSNTIAQILTVRTNAFMTASGISDATIRGALNTFDAGLISNSLDTKMKAVYPFVGGTADTHKWNFMDARDTNAAFRLTFSGTWTHSSTGALPNGTNAFANTNLNASTSLTTPSHLSYYTRTNGNTNIDQIDIGVANFWLSLWYKGSGLDAILARNQTSTVLLNGGAVTDSRGFGLTTKIGTTAKIFKNSTQVASATDTGTTYTSNTIYIAALNNGSAVLFSNRECSFASVGNGLTDGEVSTFHSLVQALQTTLGRQV